MDFRKLIQFNLDRVPNPWYNGFIARLFGRPVARLPRAGEVEDRGRRHRPRRRHVSEGTRTPAAALHRAGRGRTMHPIGPRGKHPLPAGRPQQPTSDRTPRPSAGRGCMITASTTRPPGWRSCPRRRLLTSWGIWRSCALPGWRSGYLPRAFQRSPSLARDGEMTIARKLEPPTH
jgi:hypothetical protein